MKIALAYSGGLDTSFCIPYLKNEYAAEVHAVMVDCMGVDEEQRQSIIERARHLGADQAVCLDGVQALYDRILSNLIKGNVLRDRTYPLSVGAERYVQAELLAGYMQQHGITAAAHGSTGAGNDQVRFDVALMATAGSDVEIISPVRDHDLTREDTTGYLRQQGFEVSDETTGYSINTGIWGTSIGGRETTTSDQALPFEAFPNLKAPHEYEDAPEELTLSFEQGLPVRINNEAREPVRLLNELAGFGIRHGIGHGMHMGDTIMGIKGRIGFEAPVPELIYTAHRELEKLVLSQWQRQIKDQLADTYGMMLHEARFYDPAMRDIEAFFDASQELVTGDVTLYACRGNLLPRKVSSPHDPMKTGAATYGEESSGWTGQEARAFSKLYGIAYQKNTKQTETGSSV